MVELRVDTVARSRRGRRRSPDGKRPVIITCRPQWEGGHFKGSEEERLAILREALAARRRVRRCRMAAGLRRTADRADQRQARRPLVARLRRRARRSRRRVTRAMRATGAEVVKIAVMAARLRDCLPLLALREATMRAAGADRDGRGGTRNARARRALRIGWTYAGDGVAPGRSAPTQLQTSSVSVASTRSTAIYGVVGRPVSHSLSPAMHNAAFRAARHRRRVPAARRRRLRRLPPFAEALGVSGASVTAPFKVDAFERADECRRRSARRMRAVNTLRRDGARWPARNTDVTGFLAPLAAAMRLRGRSRVGSRRGRRGASGGGRARLRGRQCHDRARDAIAQAQRRGRVADAALSDVAARPGIMGSARQRDAGRHVAGRRAIAAAARLPFDGDGSSTTSSTTRRDAVAADAARAGCRDDRRTRHAGGAGAGAIRMVDRARRRSPQRDARAARSERLSSDRARRLYEADNVRRIRGPGASAPRSCRCARRSWPICSRRSRRS